jgi:putative membrane protein
LHGWIGYWLINWLLSALALYLMARMIPGIEIRGFGSALIASIVIGVVNAILGPILRFLTFPLTILTLGLFRLLVNGFLLKVAAALAPGFRVDGCLAAVLGALVLTILTGVLHYLAWATL